MTEAEILAQIDLAAGTMVKGLWRVLRRLGEGGCGVIYEVENANWAAQQQQVKADKSKEKASTPTKTKDITPKTKGIIPKLRSRGKRSNANAMATAKSTKKGKSSSSDAKAASCTRADQHVQQPAPAGAVWHAGELPPRAALKAEPAGNRDDEVLKMEVHVMKQLQQSRHVVKLYTCGRQDKFNFIVMELLGSNLSDMRRDCPGQKFTKSTSIRLGLQCLQAIEDVHEANFVHRDIKPSNFALGAFPHTKRIVYILDFGLTRSYRVKDPDTRKMALRKPRANIAFRGTLRYCSLNVHRRIEQGRHDDLWSLVYMLIEFMTGTLPWRNADADRTVQLKETTPRAALTAGCPEQVAVMLTTLRPYTYSSEPDYNKLRKLLLDALQDIAGTNAEPFDWELGGRYYDFFRASVSTKSRACPDPAADVTERTTKANVAERSREEETEAWDLLSRDTTK